MEIESPSTPALDAARAEMTDIATNSQNPRYEAFQRGEKQVMDYLDGLYRKAAPDSAPVPIGNEGVSLRTGGPEESEPTLSPEDVQAVEGLRQEWGESFEAHLSDARFVSSRLTQALGGGVDDLTAAGLDAGGDLTLILKIASHFEQRMRAHEQGSRP